MRYSMQRTAAMKASWVLLGMMAFQAQAMILAEGRLPGFPEIARQIKNAGKLPSPVAEIMILLERNKAIVPVSAGGTSLRLILDTGMAYDGILIFGQDKADMASFSGLRGSNLAGAGSGGGTPALVSEDAGFLVGGLPFSNQRVIILQ